MTKEIRLYELLDLGGNEIIMCDLNYEDQEDFEKLKKANFYINRDTDLEDLKLVYIDSFEETKKYEKLQHEDLHHARGFKEDVDFMMELFSCNHGVPMLCVVGLNFKEEHFSDNW